MHCPSLTIVMLLIAGLVVPRAATGQLIDVSGTYTMETDRGDVLTLTLTQNTRGIVRGSLTGSGAAFRIEGLIEGDIMTGHLLLDREPIYLEAFPDYPNLVIYLGTVGIGVDYFRSQELVFTIESARAPPERTTPGRGGNPLRRGTGATGETPAPGTRGAAVGEYDGAFFGDGITLELRGVGRRYTGHLTVGGRSYPVRADVDADGNLQGSFGSGVQQFRFTARWDGDGMLLESEGESYYLGFQDTPESTPPARGRIGPGPYVPPLSDGTPLAGDWIELLRGRRLTDRLLHDSQRPRDRRLDLDLYLCSSGQFLTGGLQPGFDPRRPTPDPRPVDTQGWWRVVAPAGTPYLELWEAATGLRRFALTYRDGVVFLDDTRMVTEVITAYCR